MFSGLVKKFKENPTVYYAMSIAASWAGAGSLMNFRTLARGTGVLPAVIWGIANSAACILFGLFAERIPELRDIMRTKVMRYAIGFLTIFNTWINTNAICEVFGETPIGTAGGAVIVFAVCFFFIVILWHFGMIRNILTDRASWIAVYVVLVFLVIWAFATNGADIENISAGTDWEGIRTGLYKGLLLLPGPFTFGYFYEILDYNDRNDDGARKINVTRAFTLGGLLFGFYMIFSAALSLVEFTPAQNIIKAILITLIAVSSISSFLYSQYLLFGRKLGLAVDIATATIWPIVVPMGVMGIWTFMSEMRIYLVAVLLAVALMANAHNRAKRRSEVRERGN